jgi:hypothetical protein
MQTHAPTVTDVPALARLQSRGLILAAVGLLAGIVGAFLDLDQFFRSWLVGFLFVLGFALGSLALLMLQHLSGGQWGLVSRRVFEAASRTLPLVALLFIPIAFGMQTLFPWARPAAASDPILQMKASYLNVTFFFVRAVIYFVVWMLLSTLLTRWSAAQDRGELAIVAGDTVRFRRVSAPGMLAFFITMTFASVDWIMSLDPHWFSTIYGLLTVASQGLSALALAIAVLALVATATPVAGLLVPRHFHDLGKLLLAFVMLWAYLSFSQFLIIWSGNLPEEIPWYINRLRGGWGVVSLLLVVGHFALPFMLLLSRDLKRRPALLAQVAVAVIVMRLVDIIWLVAPSPEREGFPIHWMDIALPAGLFGLWLFVFARNLRAWPLMPLNDPYFKEAFAHDVH